MNYVIIGGGIGGLATAWYLLRNDPACSITICERGSRWGGVIASDVLAGNRIELGPDAMLTAKPAGMDLIRDVGLSDEVQATEPAARHAYIARGDGLIPIPEGLNLLAPARIWPFLTSAIVSWPAKLRMAAEICIPRRRDDGDESLGAFVRRRLGNEALERIAQPLVGAIHSADPDDLSLDAVFPRFHQFERQHGSVIRGLRATVAPAVAASGPRYGLFATLRGGLQRLSATLVERMQSQVDLRLGAAVRELRRTTDGWHIATATDSLMADAVVLALPAHASAQLLRSISPELTTALQAIPYHGVTTVNVVCPRAAVTRLPSGAGFVVPRCERRSIFACSFASHKFSGRHADGMVILRAAVGGGLNPGINAASDAELSALVCSDLRRLVGLQAQPHDLAIRIARWDGSLPQYRVGHLERIRRLREFEAALPGFALVGNAYEGTGIPDVVAGAKAAARRLVDVTQERLAGSPT